MSKNVDPGIYTIAITKQDSSFIYNNINSFSNKYIAWIWRLNFHCDCIRKLYAEYDPPYEVMNYIKLFNIDRMSMDTDDSVSIDISIETTNKNTFGFYDIPIYVIMFIIIEAAKDMEKMMTSCDDKINNKGALANDNE